MQQFLKKTIIFLFVLLLVPVSQAVTYDLFPTGEVSGTYHELTVTKVDGEYFLHKEDLLPGDTIKGKYTISNKSSSKNYELTLKSLITSNSPSSGLKEENQDAKIVSDWIKLIKLKLTLDGTVIYDGSADGSDKFNDVKAITDGAEQFIDGFVIGTIQYGKNRVLEAEFTIPESLENEYQEAWARVDWEFFAKWSSGGKKTPTPSKTPSTTPSTTPSSTPSTTPSTTSSTTPPTTPTTSNNPGGDIEENPLPAAGEIPDEPFDAPNTGDSIADIVIYIVITLGALAGILLIVFSKKKEEK